MFGIFDRAVEAITVYDDLINRFQDRQETEVVEKVATALVNKGVMFGTLDRSEEELAVYDDMLDRFQDRQEDKVVKEVERALFNKGVTLGNIGRSEEAIAVYDDLINRFQDRQEPRIVEMVARAMIEKIEVLIKTNRVKEAAPVLAVIFERKPLLDNHYEMALDCLIDIAAEGFEKNTLDMLLLTPAVTKFEPLVVALKMMTNEEFRAPQEVVEVAKDVVERIQQRREKRNQPGFEITQ
jgi:tetratricopeptide (TPR) repeat protein